MSVYIGPSESQGNAEAASRKARAESRYVKQRAVETTASRAAERRWSHDNGQSFAQERQRRADEPGLHVLKAEFRAAVTAEIPMVLQTNAGVEDGSVLGTPRWTALASAFLRAIDPADLAEDHPVAFARDALERQRIRPLRATLAAMASNQRSAVERTAATFLFLMMLDGDFDHVRAWKRQLGKFASAVDDEIVQGTADSWATEALRRWWKLYTGETPLTPVRPSDTTMGTLPACTFPTPLCPHGSGHVS